MRKSTILLCLAALSTALYYILDKELKYYLDVKTTLFLVGFFIVKQLEENNQY